MYKKLILLSLFLLSCKSYIPFETFKDKKKCINKINMELNLEKKNYKELFHNDSITQSICKSIDDLTVSKKLIKRRIDSFYLGNYTKKEMLIILELDRVSQGAEIEFDRKSKFKEYLKFKNLNDYKKYLKKNKLKFK